MNSREGSPKRGKKGQGTIRIAKSGRFEYRVTYYDESGKRKMKSFNKNAER